MQADNNNPAVMALREFLRAHAHDELLDAAAMARLNDELVPAALQAWPALRGVLETRADDYRGTAYPWTADHGFTAALTREQVFALTQPLMLQVGSPVSLPSSCLLSSFLQSFFFFFFLFFFFFFFFFLLLLFWFFLYLRVLLTRGLRDHSIIFCAPFMNLIFLPIHSFFCCVLYSSF